MTASITDKEESMMGQTVSLVVYQLLEASRKLFVQALNIIALVDDFVHSSKRARNACSMQASS